MTVSYVIFMALMTGAWLGMVAGLIRTVRFFNRHKQPEQSSLNPFDGIVLWKRLATPGAFGDEAEPARRTVLRTYALALGLFALAIVAFLVLPGMPALE